MSITTVVLRGDARAISDLVARAGAGVTVYGDAHFTGAAMTAADERGASVQVVSSGHRDAPMYAALAERCRAGAAHGSDVCPRCAPLDGATRVAVQRGGTPGASVQDSTAPLSTFPSPRDGETCAGE